MNFFLPNNIFTRLLVKNLPDSIKSSIAYRPSSLLVSSLKETPGAAALIPTMDIIQNKELFVSKTFGISFEESFCNSYFYFGPDQNKVSALKLFGDISSVEAIMSKILFRELYNIELEIGVISDESKIGNNNLLVTGDKNLHKDFYSEGVSFAEEIIETISLPFVNYVLASTESSLLEEMNSALKGSGNKIYGNLEENIKDEKLNESVRNYIGENISSLIMDLDEQDMEGIEQIIRLPYYHGLVKDIVEVKFI